MNVQPGDRDILAGSSRLQREALIDELGEDLEVEQAERSLWAVVFFVRVPVAVDAGVENPGVEQGAFRDTAGGDADRDNARIVNGGWGRPVRCSSGRNRRSGLHGEELAWRRRIGVGRESGENGF